MSTQQKYYEEYLSQGKESLGKVLTEKEANNTQYVNRINSAIDKAAQTAASGYQQSIDEAPTAALEQKEKNAMAEAINRKIVEENMANMGLTDSGLNRTQQTALTLQRGNADAAVDRQTQEYVNQLKMAIDEVMTEAETKKATNEAEVLKQTRDWYEAALVELESSAASAAATAYAADKEAEAEKTRVYYENIARSDQYRDDYIDNLMEKGYSETAALAAGYVRYPSQDEEKNKWATDYLNAYNDAKNKGYDENYVELAATAAGNGVDANAMLIDQLRKETAHVDYSKEKLSDTDDSTRGFFQNIWDVFDTDKGDIEEAKGWSNEEWVTRLNNMSDLTNSRIEKKYGTLSAPAKNYVAAKAIMISLGDAIANNAYALKLLESRFGEDIVAGAADDLGYEVSEG